MQYIDLNPRQAAILDYIKDKIASDGYPPSIREICEAVEAAMTGPTVIRSRKGYVLFQKPVMEQMEAIARKHDLDIDLTDKYNITMGYLTDWLYRKYMGKEIEYDSPLDGYKEF